MVLEKKFIRGLYVTIGNGFSWRIDADKWIYIYLQNLARYQNQEL